MTTPQLIAWLDGKMEDYDKLIPPDPVLAAELEANLEERVREQVQERILREAGYEAQVATALAAIERPDGTALRDGIEASFEEQQDRQWRDHIGAVADGLACGGQDGE